MTYILKILEIRLDDKLTAYILDHFSLFKFISPNLITISGLIMNFLILYYIIMGNIIVSSVLLILRYLADCLDGGVARKYNKKSKIGGVLDTWSDTILIYISPIYYQCSLLLSLKQRLLWRQGQFYQYHPQPY